MARQHYRAAGLSALSLGLLSLCLLSLEIRRVDGPSMEPTLEGGRLVVVWRLAYGLDLPFAHPRWAYPRRGEIVMLRPPGDGVPAIKRCYGLPGDGLVLDGDRLRVGPNTLPVSPSQAFHFMSPSSLGRGRVFVVGDNMGVSLDSREYGAVAIENILGKVLVLTR